MATSQTLKVFLGIYVGVLEDKGDELFERVFVPSR